MKHFIKQLLSCVAAVAALFYVGLQISLSIGDFIEVEHAVYGEVTETITVNGYIFRDETPIVAKGSGTVCAFYEDGEKVSRRSEILKVYDSESDAETQKKINELNNKIKLLENSAIAKTYSTKDMETLDNSITEKLYYITESVSHGNYTMAAIADDDLLVLMNKRTAAISVGSGFNMTIDKYKQEIAELEDTLSGAYTTVKTGESGYFYSETDGYEYYFTINELNSLTLEKYHSLSEITPRYSTIGVTVGKIVVSSKWYFTLELDKRTFASLTSGKSSAASYDITFPYSDNTVIPMKLENKITETSADTVVCVFSSDLLYEGFNYARSQPVYINLKSYKGLKIRESAVRVIDGVKGVYTLDGTVVKFKTVDILYTENGYCYCSLPFTDDVDRISASALSLHDPVITEGKNLYEGKIVN